MLRFDQKSKYACLEITENACTLFCVSRFALDSGIKFGNIEIPINFNLNAGEEFENFSFTTSVDKQYQQQAPAIFCRYKKIQKANGQKEKNVVYGVE